MFQELNPDQHGCVSSTFRAPILSDYRRFVPRSAGIDLIMKCMLKHVHFGCSALLNEACGDPFGWGTALQPEKWRFRLPIDIDIII